MFKNLFKPKTTTAPPPMASRYNDFRVKIKEHILVGVYDINVEDGTMELSIAIPDNDPFGDGIKTKFFNGQRLEIEALKRNGTPSGSKTYEVLSKSFEGGNSFTVTLPLHRTLRVVCEVKQVGVSSYNNGSALSMG